MTRALRDDDRGLALGIVVFFAMLVIGAVLVIALNAGWEPIAAFVTPRASSEGARAQINTAKSIWNNIIYVPLFFAVIFIIARAVREGAVR